MTKINYFKNQTGFTLVEVLGSIVILSIVVTTFLAFFIHSTRTTKVAEEVSEGLYIAQKQVEEIYHQSTYQDYNQLILDLIDQADHYQSVGTTEEFLLSKDGYQMTIEIFPVKNDANEIIDNLYTLLVKTFDQNDRQQAQLETKFLFDQAGDED